MGARSQRCGSHGALHKWRKRFLTPRTLPGPDSPDRGGKLELQDDRAVITSLEGRVTAEAGD